MEVRGYRPGDWPALYRICLRTGDSGRDATGRYADPWLLGHVYLGPYLALARRYALVLDRGDGTPVGYAVGAPDSEAFAARCEVAWWPRLRRRYPDPVGVPPASQTPDQRLAALIHHPPPAPAATARFPSHLHIDLLPEARGRGHGRALMDRLLAALAAAGSPGVHLGVDLANRAAVGFYRRLGFTELERSAGGVILAAALPRPGPAAARPRPRCRPARSGRPTST
jgi:ribosomal protein S18 acetylase RimI-like enzyme